MKDALTTIIGNNIQTVDCCCWSAIMAAAAYDILVCCATLDIPRSLSGQEVDMFCTPSQACLHSFTGKCPCSKYYHNLSQFLKGLRIVTRAYVEQCQLAVTIVIKPYILACMHVSSDPQNLQNLKAGLNAACSTALPALLTHLAIHAATASCRVCSSILACKCDAASECIFMTNASLL